jgi:hypothetical protein
MTSKVTSCPICKSKIPTESQVCPVCHAPLSAPRGSAGTTGHVPTVQPELVNRRTEHLQKLAAVPADALALFVNDEEQALVIPAGKRVVLGRASAEASPETLDLSPYDAADLGVSRQHAAVEWSDGGFILTDLGSTNGTLLNGKFLLVARKPHPLHSGDRVLLGNLRLYAYIKSEEAAAGGGEIIITLVEAPRTAPLLHRRVTSLYLAGTLIPFLQALSDLQGFIDEGRGRLRGEMVVNTISATREDVPIGVSLTGAAEAIQFARQHVNPWRIDHARALHALMAPSVAGRLSASGSDQHDPQGTTVFYDPGAAALASQKAERELQADLPRLAPALRQSLALGQPALDEVSLAAKLMPVLGVLATSPLQIAPEKSNGEG